jgi:phosphoglycerol transferase MdoB-like AlkP superfamily enzyme
MIRAALSRIQPWWLAALLYVIALPLPAVVFSNGTGTGSGMWCLFVGVFAPTPAWANVALALSALCAAFKRRFAALLFASFAVLLAASTLLLVGGVFRGVRAGFWCWLASIALMFWERARAMPGARTPLEPEP